MTEQRVENGALDVLNSRFPNVRGVQVRCKKLHRPAMSENVPFWAGVPGPRPDPGLRGRRVVPSTHPVNQKTEFS